MTQTPYSNLIDIDFHTGQVPTEIGQLTAMMQLGLDSNHLTGTMRIVYGPDAGTTV